MRTDMIAVIQAGGKGSRLRALTGDSIPKPLISLDGKPMIQWQIENLKKHGVHEFIIIVGYLGERLMDYFGKGDKLGVHIQYVAEAEPLGSAGALFYLKDRLGREPFILVFGDVMFDVDMRRMSAFHENKRALATLLVHPNSHPQDSDLVIMDDNECVTGFDAKTNIRDYWYDNCVNAGIYILNPEILKEIPGPVKTDLEKDLLFPMIGTGRIFGYQTTEYVKDAGTVERFGAVEREHAEGLWHARSLVNQQTCIFLDRDGTINQYKGFLSREDEFELEEHAAEAIRLINASGYLAIVITNQPVVARGMCGIGDVKNIHRKMSVLLGEQGAYLDDIAFCPHHPDKGYPDENPLYKVACGCRKPKTGMIDAMAEKYNIDRTGSFMVGDSTVDVQTGINAGLKTVLVHTGQAGSDKKFDVKADREAADILEAVKWILKEAKDI